MLGLLSYASFLHTAKPEHACVHLALFVSECVLHFIISPLKMTWSPPQSVKRSHTERCMLQPVSPFNPLKISANTKQVQLVAKPLPDLQLPEWAVLYLHNVQ